MALNAEFIKEKVDAYWQSVADRENEGLKRPMRSIRASMIGACSKRIYSMMVEPWESIPWYTPGLCRIFQDGELHERQMVHDLEAAGFKINRQQFVVDNHPELKKHNISGTCDFSIEWGGEWVPADCKSLNMMTFQEVKSIENMKESYWMSKYVSQGQIYAYGQEKPIFIFPLKDKNNSDLKFIEMPIDHEHVKTLLEKASLINFAVRQKEPPPRITWGDECLHCPFLQHCLPDMFFKTDVEFVNNTDITRILDNRQRHVASYREYNRQHELAKELLKKVNCPPGGKIMVPGYEIKKSVNGRFTISQSGMDSKDEED